MTEVTYRDALNEALAAELEADQDVVLIGEDVAAAGGVFKVTDGLLDRFGPERVRDTPISEQAIVGTVLGAAVTGLRPVAEVMFADFAGVCFDQIANQLPKYRYMTGGQVSVPVTLRLVNGASTGFGAQHSQAVENWFLGLPGLKICVPGTPADAYGLLRTAIRDDNPVLLFEHKALYMRKGPLDPGETVPLGRADVVRAGEDVTVVATQLMRERALQAADRLAEEGIRLEVIDPRSLVPFDLETVVRSVEKTANLLVVEEGPGSGGWGSTLVARIAEEAFEMLDAPPRLICTDETPTPFAAELEEAWLPSADAIVGGVRDLELVAA
ncbi:MAG TPA: alpha-ketoacid dehydrogenase subunit beta [Solirubrobacterales bacterium]|nr:alpha-ketoacid dehydrogenase subunit beta [Solirubrobacterales bacterium]